ncbi:MAG: hypothetical protein ACJAVV_003954 [Alphaproteobacteria bacterium]|jgi:hypothetical protein
MILNRQPSLKFNHTIVIPKFKPFLGLFVLLILKLVRRLDYSLLSTTALRPIPRYRTCQFSINLV